ncbi:MAG TPA: FliH/SctL family protein [Acidimicrobiales bacterium]|nr:FliH/SctL family protein [Acidimicrobiales bacterium]
MTMAGAGAHPILRKADGGHRISPVRPELLAAVNPFETARSESAARGYEEGRRAATEEAQAELAAERDFAATKLAAALAALEAATAESREAFDRLAATLEGRITGLVLELVEELFQREVAVAASPGRDAIARALHLAPAEGPVVVRLHPEDAATLGEHAVGARALTVRPDPAIARGGCVLEVGSTLVDSQVDSALERVRAVLDGTDGGGSR